MRLQNRSKTRSEYDGCDYFSPTFGLNWSFIAAASTRDFTVVGSVAAGFHSLRNRLCQPHLGNWVARQCLLYTDRLGLG